MYRRGWYSLSLLSAVVVLAGCGGREDRWSADRPQVVSAGGTVLYNGDPVEGANVVFAPEEGSNAAVGRTDSRGRFQLRTFEPNDGAVPGEYKVTIRKVEVISAGGDEPPDEEGDDEAEVEERSLLPEQYGSAESSGLTATVSDGGDNNFTFELSD